MDSKDTTTVNIKDFDAQTWASFKAETITRRLKIAEAAQEALTNWTKGGVMKVKDVVYRTPSFSDAENRKEEYQKKTSNEFFIDSFISNRRTDSYGGIIEQREYEVYRFIEK